MNYPWNRRSSPLSSDAYAGAAASLGCSEGAIRAVASVESGASWIRLDGSVERRFEPHKMPGSSLTWRDSLKIKSRRRGEMLREAYGRMPEKAMQATSWGGFQIMGFNHLAAGYNSAGDMVRAMAKSQDAHLEAFVALVKDWGLDGAIRAHDWETFARRYNGSGQPEVYARKMEEAYRRFSGGQKSPTVLRTGSRGAGVRRLQEALGVQVDGVFGPGTETAVREFQSQSNLTVDGVVGRVTWTALEKTRDARPRVQPTTIDDLVGKVTGWLPKIGAGAVAVEGVREVMSPTAYDVLTYGAIGIALAAVAFLVYRKLRNT